MACLRAASNYWLAQGAEPDLADLVDEALHGVDDRPTSRRRA